MKVIFTDSIANVAFKGDVKNVRPGYFRNFLLPRGKAVLASPDMLALWDKKRQEVLMEKEQVKKKAVEVKEKLETVTLKIAKKITSKGTLYSSITEKDVAAALAKQSKVEVDVNNVTLSEHIKELGKFEVPVQLASGVKAIIHLEVVAQE